MKTCLRAVTHRQRKRHTVEQIIKNLRQVDEGCAIESACYFAIGSRKGKSAREVTSFRSNNVARCGVGDRRHLVARPPGASLGCRRGSGHSVGKRHRQAPPRRSVHDRRPRSPSGVDATREDGPGKRFAKDARRTSTVRWVSRSIHGTRKLTPGGATGGVR